MKCLVVFLVTVVALTAGYEIQEPLKAMERSISTQVVDMMEAWKLQMPCGFPGVGIPVLAPLKLEHKAMKIDGDSVALDGEVNRFRLYGLDEFDIVEFKVNAIFSRVNFKFHWHNPYLKTLYKMWMRTSAGLKVQVERESQGHIALKNFVVWGQIKYSLGVISGNLRVKEIKIYASVDDVVSEIEDLSGIKIVNRKLNEIVEELIMTSINENTENIAELSNNYIVPIVNNIIGDKSLGDLIGAIGGGGGGEKPEPIECIPPEDGNGWNL